MTLVTQLARFASVGLIATLLHIGVAMICATLLAFAPHTANGAGFCAAVAFSYVGHGRFAFEADLQHSFHAPRFLTTALIGFALSSGITEVTVIWLGLPFAVGMAVVAVAVPATTYLLCRLWVFRPG
ncbi:GtrA family protein [Roseobacter sp. A03A-229]